jgi:hypothetical protein
MKLLAKVVSQHPTNRHGDVFEMVETQVLVDVDENAKVWEIKQILKMAIEQSQPINYLHLPEARWITTQITCFLE